MIHKVADALKADAGRPARDALKSPGEVSSAPPEQRRRKVLQPLARNRDIFGIDLDSDVASLQVVRCQRGRAAAEKRV